MQCATRSSILIVGMFGEVAGVMDLQQAQERRSQAVAMVATACVECSSKQPSVVLWRDLLCVFACYVCYV